ncbi:MAG: cupin [Bacteroidota bacterium]
MKQIEPTPYYFDDDGITPNNQLPVLVYRNAIRDLTVEYADYFEKTFQSNNWTNNWRDIIASRDHYHSTTHEVLGISSGSVRLNLGGQNGTAVEVTEGDVLVIPAGVGHYSLVTHENYQVIGGYPDGGDWDMIYNEPEKYLKAKEEIAQLSIPKTDPVYGHGMFLAKFWGRL